MKKIYIIVLLAFTIAPMFGYVANAQSGYYMSEEQYQQEEARKDNLQNQADMQEYELDSKVAGAEEQEKKEQAEADKANKKLLMYVTLGAVGLFGIFFISHELQKPKARTNYKK